MKQTLLTVGYIKDSDELPIDYVVKNVKNNKILIFKASTGSGKSTILPYYLYKNGFKRIISLQPRVLNCISIPNSIAYHNKDMVIGKNLGYQTGDYKLYIESGITFMTNGTFMQNMLANEHFLENYDIIIVDEAHEMDLLSNNLHFLLRELLYNSKSQLKVIITSATFDYKHVAEYYKTENIIKIKGSTFPIEDIFLENDSMDLPTDIVNLIIKIHNEDKIIKKSKYSLTDVQDILLFVPGIKEMQMIIDKLDEKSKELKGKLKIIKLDSSIIEKNGI